MEQADVIRNRIVDEIFFALGLGRSSWLRRTLGFLFYLPANHLAQIAASLEDEAPRTGTSGAALRILPDLSLKVTTHGVENIPPVGPLLIVSNHPGAYDSIVVPSSIPRRDLKLVVSDVGLAHALTNCSQDFIFVSTDTTERMAALRASIHHLQSGGALLIFPNGEVEPDPAIMPGAEKTIQGWSPSIEIMLRKAPDTNLQLVIVSGVIMSRFIHNPLTRIRRMPYHQQKMAELLEILQQMLFPRSLEFHPCVSFARPIPVSELPASEMMPVIIQKARQLLQEHNTTFPPHERN